MPRKPKRHMNSANVTPRPTTDTRPPLPALHALILVLAPPSDTAAADALLVAPEGDPVLVALMPLVDWPPARPVACARPVAVGWLALPPLLPP